MKALVEPLVEAALDQPSPTPELRRAVNRVLYALEHPCALPPKDMGVFWKRQVGPSAADDRTVTGREDSTNGSE